MATPAIALRFRNTTPGIDTISEHLKVLANRSMVWWGWWKKDTELLRPDVLERQLPSGTTGTLLLADSVSRMWSATCSRWTIDPHDVDLDLLPAYYRSAVDRVAAFFLITELSPTAFDKELSDDLILGEKTFLDLGDPEDRRNAKATADGHLSAPIDAKSRSSVLHLSDLHFGKDYGFRTSTEIVSIGDQRRTLTECLVRDLERIGMHNDIGAVVVTGDFISGGDWDDGVREAIFREFESLRSALGIGCESIVAAPGNHDIVRYRDGQALGVADQSVQRQTNQRHEREYRTFVNQLVGRDWQKPLNFVSRVQLQSADILLCVLNSCTITATQWTEYGFVGSSGLATMRLLASQPSVRPTYKCLALHHHLLPVADIETPQAKGVSLTLDASQLLEEAQGVGVQLALHGHQHVPKIARYQNIALMGAQSFPPIHVVSNGSTGAKKDRLGSERNTYCVFTFTDKGAGLHFRALRPDGKDAGAVFQGELDLEPHLP